ncbi:MAG: cupin domain-containing protein [Planctomycetes bacterium]|nr:cupin domain-containing protein [Planctomycetota bacterium]MBI3834465.1 cupin domain-containing protein [Planctomycetota bacterium]
MAATGSAKRFRWDELTTDAPMALLDRRRVIGEHAMISQVHLQKGCFVPSHAHANEQFVCIMKGRLHFVLNEGSELLRENVTVGAGEVLHLPPNVPHSAEALEDTIVLDVFSPPSQKTGIDGPAQARGHSD